MICTDAQPLVHTTEAAEADVGGGQQWGGTWQPSLACLAASRGRVREAASRAAESRHTVGLHRRPTAAATPVLPALAEHCMCRPLQDKDAAVAKFRRWLRPGGRLAFNNPLVSPPVCLGLLPHSRASSLARWCSFCRVASAGEPLHTSEER